MVGVVLTHGVLHGRFVGSDGLPVGGVVNRVTTHGETLESRLLTGDSLGKHLVVGVGEVHEGDVVSSSHVVRGFRVVEAGSVLLVFPWAG